MSEEDKTAWLESLPEELRDAPYLAKAESPADALAKIQHAAKVVGSSLRIPEKDASADDKKAFYEQLTRVDGVTILPTSDDEDGFNTLMKKLGVPEKDADYALPELEEFAWDDLMGEQLRKYAHESKMTARQFKTFATNIAQQEKDAAVEEAGKLSEADSEISAAWGGARAEREALVRGWLDKSQAPQDLRESLDNNKLGFKTIQWLHGIAEQFKDNVNPMTKDGKQPLSALDPEQLQDKLFKIRTDLMNMPEGDSRYRALQQKMIDYHKQLAEVR